MPSDENNGDQKRSILGDPGAVSWAGGGITGLQVRRKKAPGNRLLPDHYQTPLPMLPPDWAEKSLCPIDEQELLSYYGAFLHDGY